MNIFELTEGLRNPKDNPCWKGYKPVGTKKKAGRTVPNCVPVKEAEEKVIVNGKLVDPTSLEVEDIDTKDYPDFSDAYFSAGQFTDGSNLSDNELDILKDRYPELLYKKIESRFYEDSSEARQMATNSIHTLKRAVDGLHQLVSQGQELPEWCKEKITMSKQNLVTIWNYLLSQKEHGSVDECTTSGSVATVSGGIGAGDPRASVYTESIAGTTTSGGIGMVSKPLGKVAKRVPAVKLQTVTKRRGPYANSL